MVLGALIAKDDTWMLWAIIIVWATISLFLEQRYKWASTISGAIIALVGAMLLSNFKVIPTSSPVYDTVWDFIVPLSIPLLLFSSNILKIWKESRRLLFIMIARIRTMIGTVVAFLTFNQWIPYLSKIGAIRPLLACTSFSCVLLVASCSARQCCEQPMSAPRTPLCDSMLCASVPCESMPCESMPTFWHCRPSYVGLASNSGWVDRGEEAIEAAEQRRNQLIGLNRISIDEHAL